ncbi:MAG TPA: hypothetical protein VLE21_06050 [Candidatus Nitrosocosmicus sp.]|nr:hypothetical protein [Candidatus Nitrosocosmicus sp.]
MNIYTNAIVSNTSQNSSRSNFDRYLLSYISKQQIRVREFYLNVNIFQSPLIVWILHLSTLVTGIKAGQFSKFQENKILKSIPYYVSLLLEYQVAIFVVAIPRRPLTGSSNIDCIL